MESDVVARFTKPHEGPPPKENLYRAVKPGYELREATTIANGAMPTLTGYFAVFNEWTEIDSIWEGTFMERVAPGAFAKTIAENRANMRVLFQHGMDSQIGSKVLGPIETLHEDKTGPYYEVPLLDTSYNRDLIPGLEKDLYGASFKFRVMVEEFADETKASAYNPKSLPERTIREARVMEFGPVTFPAYEGATAGVRSITDEIMFGAFVGSDPEKLLRLVEFVRAAESSREPTAPSTAEAGSSTSEPEGRPVVRRRKPIDYLTRKEQEWKL